MPQSYIFSLTLLTFLKNRTRDRVILAFWQYPAHIVLLLFWDPSASRTKEVGYTEEEDLAEDFSILPRSPRDRVVSLRSHGSDWHLSKPHRDQRELHQAGIAARGHERLTSKRLAQASEVSLVDVIAAKGINHTYHSSESSSSHLDSDSCSFLWVLQTRQGRHGLQNGILLLISSYTW